MRNNKEYSWLLEILYIKIERKKQICHLQICNMQNLCVTNSFFKTRPQHKVAWIHPRSKHWHQFDLILVRRCHINDVLLTRSCHSADCYSDCLLICCKMHISKEFMHKSKETCKVRLDIVGMHDPDQVKKFQL